MDGTLLNKKYKLDERVTALEEGGGGGSLPDYSTTEQLTGQKWIDGKDIYFKVYHLDNLANNTNVILEQDFGATKNAIKFEGNVNTVEDNKKYCFSATHYSSAADCAYVCVVENNLVVYIRSNYSAYSGDFVVYYTKAEVTKKRSTKKKSEE